MTVFIRSHTIFHCRYISINQITAFSPLWPGVSMRPEGHHSFSIPPTPLHIKLKLFTLQQIRYVPLHLAKCYYPGTRIRQLSIPPNTARTNQQMTNRLLGDPAITCFWRHLGCLINRFSRQLSYFLNLNPITKRCGLIYIKNILKIQIVIIIFEHMTKKKKKKKKEKKKKINRKR